MDDQTRRLEEALQAKETALRDLRHRTKNSLQLVISLLKLQSGRIQERGSRAAFEQALQRIEALAIAYRHLHESESETQVDLGRYLSELADTTWAGLISRGGTAVQTRTEQIHAELSLAVPLGLIVNELVMNALRHAFPAHGWVRIGLRRLDAASAELLVTDNGRGLPPGFDSEADAAMMLVEALAGQIEATVSAQTMSAGTELRVVFPTG